MNKLTTKENYDLIRTDTSSEPTSRCLPPHHSHMEEWVEYGVLGDKNVAVYYLFDSEAVKDLSPDYYSWDFEHVDRIVEND